MKKYNQFIIGLYEHIYEKIGWESKKGESHSDKLLRPYVLTKMGLAGYADAQKIARENFDKVISGTQIHADIKSPIYDIIASVGDRDDFQKMLALYEKETLSEEQERIGIALGDFKDAAILEKVCELCLTEKVRKQDAVGFLSSVAMNAKGRDIWWKFIKKNWNLFTKRYGGWRDIDYLVKGISGSAQKKHLIDFKKFFKNHDAPGAKRAVQQVIEKLEGNVEFFRRDGKKIEGFLNSKN